LPMESGSEAGCSNDSGADRAHTAAPAIRTRAQQTVRTRAQQTIRTRAQHRATLQSAPSVPRRLLHTRNAYRSVQELCRQLVCARCQVIEMLWRALHGDVLQVVLAFLARTELQRCKCVCHTWRTAARHVLSSATWQLASMTVHEMLREWCISDAVVIARLQRYPAEATIKCAVTGRFPLHEACAYHSHHGVVSTLLALCPQAASLCDWWKLYPLHLAARNNASATLVHEIMFAAPSSLHTCDANGWLPLHHAAHNFSTDALLVLLFADKRSTEHKDALGRTPLHVFAASQLHEERTDILSACVPSKDVLECLSHLLEAAPEAAYMPDVFGEYPLCAALRMGAAPSVLHPLAMPSQLFHALALDHPQMRLHACTLSAMLWYITDVTMPQAEARRRLTAARLTTHRIQLKLLAKRVRRALHATLYKRVLEGASLLALKMFYCVAYAFLMCKSFEACCILLDLLGSHGVLMQLEIAYVANRVPCSVQQLGCLLPRFGVQLPMMQQVVLPLVHMSTRVAAFVLGFLAAHCGLAQR